MSRAQRPAAAPEAERPYRWSGGTRTQPARDAAGGGAGGPRRGGIRVSAGAVLLLLMGRSLRSWAAPRSERQFVSFASSIGRLLRVAVITGLSSFVCGSGVIGDGVG